MPLLTPTANLQQGAGRPAKYGPLPTSETEMYPMRLEEITFRIKYFKGIVLYVHQSEHFEQSLALKLTKPDLQTFIDEMYKEGLVFSCYYDPTLIEALLVSIVAFQKSTPQQPQQPHTNNEKLFSTPKEFLVPETRKSTDAAYDSDLNPIAVKIAPGRWKMGHKIMNSDGRPVEFKKGYNPLRDELFDEFMCMQGYAYWEDDDEVWYVWNERPNGSKHPEIPEDSIYRPLEGLDPFQFPVANTIRKSYSRATPEQTYEEQQTMTPDDILALRHKVKMQGRDPNSMPHLKLPKGMHDHPDNWVDPELND